MLRAGPGAESLAEHDMLSETLSGLQRSLEAFGPPMGNDRGYTSVSIQAN